MIYISDTNKEQIGMILFTVTAVFSISYLVDPSPRGYNYYFTFQSRANEF
jgi:hypothetical protein